MNLVALDGATLTHDITLRADAVVVGSGPGGATVARALAQAGADVVVIEEGRWRPPDELPTDAVGALGSLYRDSGLGTARGTNPPIPLLHAAALGGTSVVNSGICWLLPEDVHQEWVDADPALHDDLPFEWLTAAGEALEARLGVQPTPPELVGRSGDLLGQAADALGLAHRPTRRNVTGCQGRGACNRGCPLGAKQSMDRSLLPDAVAAGARIVTSTRVDHVERSRDGSARAVRATTTAGARVTVHADRAVVISAGAVHSPALLLGSGLDRGPVGRNFQCHPGITVAGRFASTVRTAGATQGHEVTGLLAERIKIESLSFDDALLALHLPGIGRSLATSIDQMAHWVTWVAAVRARGTGVVRRGRRGPVVRFRLGDQDRQTLARAAQVLHDLFAAVGADVVHPHRGVRPQVAISHMFSTCALGTDPARSVVRPDLRHHWVDRLYVADASALPTNLGVNPQLSIMSLAAWCAANILGAYPRAMAR